MNLCDKAEEREDGPWTGWVKVACSWTRLITALASYDDALAPAENNEPVRSMVKG
jgi:hypothetical protein